MTDEKKYNVIGKVVSSLEKVLPMRGPSESIYSSVMLKNECLNFQLAFQSNEEGTSVRNYIKVEGSLAKYITLRYVENVPVRIMPEGTDDYYIGDIPGMFPDILKPVSPLGFVLPFGQWRSIWVQLECAEGLPVGEHNITFILCNANNEEVMRLSHLVQVVDATLEETDFPFTNWMHYDCICEWYKVEPFTDEFYAVFEQYLEAYLRSGGNMLLVPLFTPPLDTAIGGERKTVQLVDVELQEDIYSFDFTKLKKFLCFILERGIRYIEFSHLFTQWGGCACPKIMVKVDGTEKNLFGWAVASTSNEYKKFLKNFLPKLVEIIEDFHIKESCYIHLTDEPHEKDAATYEECARFIKQYTDGIKIMDAISQPVFYQKALVDVPVVYIPAVPLFEVVERKNLFVYYCGGPTNEYFSNRFINMPSLRTRIIGTQLYQTGVSGFLHWGFNFYNSYLSLERVNPYAVTDAGYFYPAGDGFIVYPTDKGVDMSIRAELQYEALQDYRLLKTLEKLSDRAYVLKILNEYAIDGFREYPKEETSFFAFRQRIISEIGRKQDEKMAD